MPAMWIRAAVVLVVAVSMTSCTMWSKPASGWSGATGGEKLEQLFWDDVKNKDFVNVDHHIGGTFTGSGARGSMDRAAFLQELKSYQLTGVSLAECASTLNGADVMIACTVQREGATPARVHSLSVWQQYKKGWIMVAHAETPAAG